MCFRINNMMRSPLRLTRSLHCRRKQREQKQYSKQVQAERIKEKAQDKKRQIDSISKLRKSREKSVSMAHRMLHAMFGCREEHDRGEGNRATVYILTFFRAFSNRVLPVNSITTLSCRTWTRLGPSLAVRCMTATGREARSR